MKSQNAFTAAILLTWPLAALAEEVDLPAPVLEWSFYVLLIFGAVVAVGIFFKRGKDKRIESMSELLEEHHATIHSVVPDISVTECVRQMNEQRIGAMLVMEGEKLLGIFTERDAITKVLGGGLEPTFTKVSLPSISGFLKWQFSLIFSISCSSFTAPNTHSNCTRAMGSFLAL